MDRKPTTIPVKAAHLRGRYIDNAPAQNVTLPPGPFKPGDKGCEGNLLLFTPRNANSTFIDILTGRYGYSHLAVDCGEVDIPSGKRVMIEVTIDRGVHNAFQDEYGERKFVRIPLQNAGVDVREFCECIQAKLGEKYDDEEALTRGLLHNPAKQICSDLATICLPEEMRVDIAHHHRAGFIHPFSAVSVYGTLNKEFRLFVSPNGFAEYFGAPKGRKLQAIDQLSEPVITSQPKTSRCYSKNWMVIMAAISGLVLAWFFFKRMRRPP
jgi:hypothetical protein